MSETKLLKKIQLYASKLGFRLWRNNVAKAYSGNQVYFCKQREFTTLFPGDILIRGGRIIHAGLCSGSSDLIGIKPTIVTKDMVGEELGVFTAVEIKTKKGKVSPIQNNFLEVIAQMGGISKVARCTEDLEDLTYGAKKNL